MYLKYEKFSVQKNILCDWVGVWFGLFKPLGNSSCAICRSSDKQTDKYNITNKTRNKHQQHPTININLPTTTHHQTAPHIWRCSIHPHRGSVIVSQFVQQCNKGRHRWSVSPFGSEGQHLWRLPAQLIHTKKRMWCPLLTTQDSQRLTVYTVPAIKGEETEGDI